MAKKSKKAVDILPEQNTTAPEQQKEPIILRYKVITSIGPFWKGQSMDKDAYIYSEDVDSPAILAMLERKWIKED